MRDRRPALLALALVVAALAAWETLGAGGPRAAFLPPPSTWASALGDLAASGRLAADVTATLRRLAGGLAIGVTVGTTVGLGLGLVPRLHGVVDPLVAVFQPLPKLALYPLMLLLLGLGEAPRTLLVALSAFFPTYITTSDGVRGIDPRLLDVVRSVGGGRAMRLRRVVLPAAVPSMLSGLRIAVNNGLLVTIGLELVSAGDGIGAAIWASWQNLRSDRLFAMLVVLGLLGTATTAALRAVDRRTARWRPPA